MFNSSIWGRKAPGVFQQKVHYHGICYQKDTETVDRTQFFNIFFLLINGCTDLELVNLDRNTVVVKKELQYPTRSKNGFLAIVNIQDSGVRDSEGVSLFFSKPSKKLSVETLMDILRPSDIEESDYEYGVPVFFIQVLAIRIPTQKDSDKKLYQNREDRKFKTLKTILRDKE